MYTVGYYAPGCPEVVALLEEAVAYLRTLSVKFDVTLVPVLDLPDPPLDALLWYYERGLEPNFPEHVHRDHSIILLTPRRLRDPDAIMSCTLPPGWFWIDYIIFPFDPEECAVRLRNTFRDREKRLALAASAESLQ